MEACINRIGGWKDFLRFIGGEGKVHWGPVIELWLEFVGLVNIPASTKEFVVLDNFKFAEDGGICSSFNDCFFQLFLSGNGSICGPTQGRTIQYHETRREAPTDRVIINEIGGEKKSETTLRDMFFLMEKQKSGEDGILLTNGSANIFYIYRHKGLRPVGVFRHKDGWAVNGNYSIDDLLWWGGGVSRVFSPSPIPHVLAMTV